MKTPHPKMFAAFAACGLIMAGCLAPVRGHAADATADYVAPLDMTSSYAEDAMGYPAVLSNALSQRSSSAETTGVGSMRTAADIAAPAQASEDLVENGWDFTNPDSIIGFGSLPQPGVAPTDETNRMTARK